MFPVYLLLLCGVTDHFRAGVSSQDREEIDNTNYNMISPDRCSSPTPSWDSLSGR
jgi:hypothetical protein